MKTAKPYIIGLIFTIIAELVIFNFSSLISLKNKPIKLQYTTVTEMSDELAERLREEEGSDAQFHKLDEITNVTEFNTIVYIKDIDSKITNLHFNLPVVPNGPVRYTVSLSDEGDYYEYPLPSGTLSALEPTSFYANVHSYGKVKSMTITFNQDIRIDGIEANCVRPLFFNWIRVLLIYLIITFGIAVKGRDVSVKVWRISTIATVITFILLGFFITTSHKFYNESINPHQLQYKELAHALKVGKVSLDYEPSQELLIAPNPYDTIYLQANNIEYKGDYALYNGKYYVYFGIVPEILVYLPYHMITGGDFPNYLAVFLFYSAFVVGTFWMYKEFIKRFFPKATLSSYLIVGSFTVSFGSYAYILETADIYSVPIMCALALTVWGLFFWLRGLNESSQDAKRFRIGLLYVFGSVCMAMVAGARPQFVLFSALAFPLFWDKVFHKRELFSRKSVGKSIGLLLPYVIVALLLMIYNDARFNSPWDFGATYSLTNNDMNLRGNSISRMLLGLLTFLFQPASVNSVFPFLHSADLEYSYMGRMITEYFFGGIIISNALCLSLFFVNEYRNTIRTKQLSAFLIMNLALSLIIGLFDANQAGMLTRYTADMSFGIVLATGVVIMVLWEKKENRALIKFGLVLQFIYAAAVIFNSDAGISIYKYNPELFYKAAALFRF